MEEQDQGAVPLTPTTTRCSWATSRPPPAAVTFLHDALSRVIFRKFGWGTAALITPTVLLITGARLPVSKGCLWLPIMPVILHGWVTVACVFVSL